MTSYFARNRRFSPETHEASYNNTRTRHITDRLAFYMSYLKDIVPHEVTVEYVPGGAPSNARQEIHLVTPSGQIFMSGLIGTETSHHRIEEVAASEAYTKWLDGEFAPDGENWRFFTGLTELRFFKSDQGDSWEMAEKYHPMHDPEYVAAFLQEEYDSLRH